MSGSESGRTEEEAPDLTRLAADWVALWQGEMAAMAADPELLSGWAAAMAALSRQWMEAYRAAPAWPPAPGWPPGYGMPGYGPPAFGAPGFPPGFAGGFAPPGFASPWPMGWPPAPVPPYPATGGPDDYATRPAAPAGASRPGAEPGDGDDGGDPLRARLDALERELAGLRAALGSGAGGTRADPARARRKR